VNSNQPSNRFGQSGTVLAQLQHVLSRTALSWPNFSTSRAGPPSGPARLSGWAAYRASWSELELKGQTACPPPTLQPSNLSWTKRHVLSRTAPTGPARLSGLSASNPPTLQPSNPPTLQPSNLSWTKRQLSGLSASNPPLLPAFRQFMPNPRRECYKRAGCPTLPPPFLCLRPRQNRKLRRPRGFALEFGCVPEASGPGTAGRGCVGWPCSA